MSVARTPTLPRGENSVLVIDEPEVSLHPAWQRIYLPRLLETLDQFPQTHAIIATHSHFMVSDVSEKKASLTVASNVPGSRFQSFDGDVCLTSAPMGPNRPIC